MVGALWGQYSYKKSMGKTTYCIYDFFDSEVGPCIWEFLKAIWGKFDGNHCFRV